MAEDQQSAAPASPTEGDNSQPTTVELPLAAVGEVKAGDTISLKVISVDEQSGVVNATPMSQQAEEGSEPGGSDQLAAELDKEPK